MKHWLFKTRAGLVFMTVVCLLALPFYAVACAVKNTFQLLAATVTTVRIEWNARGRK